MAIEGKRKDLQYIVAPGAGPESLSPVGPVTISGIWTFASGLNVGSARLDASTSTSLLRIYDKDLNLVAVDFDITSLADGETAMALTWQDGVTRREVSRVSVGIVDSGGVGYRLLRVENA